MSKAMKIAIVDDEKDMRQSISQWLALSGFDTETFASAEDALKGLSPDYPGIVVSDIKMPGMDGIEAARLITKDRICGVLVLTAFSQRELVERARDAGVMAYVVKPFSISDLVPAIEIAISRHRQMKSLEDEVADLYERLETRKIIDRAKGILMKAMGLTEPESFSWIQKTAMDRRISMKQVAQAVISPESAPDR